MRLINARTLVLEKPRYGQATPPYAILSHTWEDEEITFQEFVSTTAKIKAKKGYTKITQACALALKDGIGYVWVDTCCIDKTSSAELAEAINSMFQWYRDARVCYAFLSDLEPATPSRVTTSSSLLPSTKSSKVSSEAAPVVKNDVPLSQLKSCRWFTRGWTLQELVAPAQVHFFDRDWKPRGTKHGMIRVLHEVTGIQTAVLEHSQNMYTLPIVARMSWASKRETSRIEDMAYCLMGIFDVNMPLLYGEGKKAFTRLQHEIIKSISDLSIFAWSTGPERAWGVAEDPPEKTALHFSPYEHAQLPLLSSSPSAFKFPANRLLRPWEITSHIEYSVTNVGIRISCCLLQICLLHSKSTTVCGRDETPTSPQPGSAASAAACHTNCNFRAYVLELSNNTGGSSSQGYHGGEWGIILRKLRPDRFVRAGSELVWLGPVRRNNLAQVRVRTTPRDVLIATDLRFTFEPAGVLYRPLNSLSEPGKPPAVPMNARLRVSLNSSNIRFRSAFPESRWDYIQFAFFLETVPLNQRWGMISIQVSRSSESGSSSSSSNLTRAASIRSQHKRSDSKESHPPSSSTANPTCRPCIFFDHEFTRLWILDEETPQAQGALSNIRRCGSEWNTGDVENCLRDAGLLEKKKEQNTSNAKASSGGSGSSQFEPTVVSGEDGGASVTGTVAGREIRVDIVTNGDGSWCELGLSCVSK